MLETLWRGMAILYTSDSEKTIAKNIGTQISSYGVPIVIGSIKSFDIDNLLKCYDALIFISPIGVAVRTLCGKLVHKSIDPPVIVVDPSGRFVIPVIGAHWGANEIALELSRILKLEPVITTASDSRGITSIEQLARILHCHIENIDDVQILDSALLRGEEICVYGIDSMPSIVRGKYIVDGGKCRYIFFVRSKNSDIDIDLENARIVWCKPYTISIGVGAHNDTDANEVAIAIREALDEVNIDLSSIKCIVSIKPIVKEVANILGVPFKLVKLDEINSIDDICLTPPSPNIVKYGFRGVAEACAIYGCSGKAHLIFRKRVFRRNVTIAMASCRDH
ncbi:MAG: cobalamin biosynthesis protein [Ignisphaera sp.]